MTDDGDRLRADLARYYDQDAAERAARTLPDERVARREWFIGRLRGEGRQRLIEIGTGPGIDAAAFLAAGFDVTGVDLSPAHVELARAAGIDAHVAAAQRLPFASGSFDALWSMSVLMHMPDPDLLAALAEFARVLRPGGLAAFGMWGGDGTAGPHPDDTFDPPRYFNWRTDAAMATAIRRHARIESFETLPVRSANGRTFHYQWAVARFGEGAAATPLGH
ncbi:MAG: class I SAM-dependent methyltransferase [Candidatus Limnocylindrales bacterium]